MTFVGIGISDWHREIERQGSRSQGRYGDAKPKTRRDSEILPIDIDIPFDRSIVDKGHHPQHVVGRDRKHVLKGAEELKPTPDAHVVLCRSSPTELESSQGRKTASKEVLEDRLVRSCESGANRRSEGVPSRSVGSLANQEVLAEVDLPTREIELAKDLVVDQLKQMPFSRQKRAVAGVVRQSKSSRVQVVASQRPFQVFDPTNSGIEHLDIFTSQLGRYRQVRGDVIAQGDSPPEPLLGPIAVETGEVKPTDRKTKWGVSEKIRFGPVHRITLDLVARHQFEPEVLPGAAKSTIEHVTRTARDTKQVEVSLFDHKLPGDPQVAVDRPTERHTSCLAFRYVHVDRSVSDRRIVSKGWGSGGPQTRVDGPRLIQRGHRLVHRSGNHWRLGRGLHAWLGITRRSRRGIVRRSRRWITRRSRRWIVRRISTRVARRGWQWRSPELGNGQRRLHQTDANTRDHPRGES